MEFGWLSLLPPIIAIVLAIVTRRVLISLGLSILSGAVLLAWPQRSERNLLVGTFDSAWNDHLWPAFADGAHQQVFIFSLTLGAMVGVIEAAGGMESLIHKVTRKVRTGRGGQMMVWLLGLAIFFDDYANTLLLGSTMRKAADRLKFSRAKLAYLVDSTAAPVAGLALVSTWVATEISQIDKGLESAGVSSEISAFSVFLGSVPYRFYAILALVMVAVIAWSGRDFGPMLAEEEKANSDAGDTAIDSSDSNAAAVSSSELRSTDTYELRQASGGEPGWLWATAVVPVLVCVGVVCIFLLKTGLEATGETELTGLRYWGEVIGNADSYIALVWGSVSGLVFALALGTIGINSMTTPRPISDLVWGLLKGAWQIFPAMVILWLAWSLSSMTDGSSELDDGSIRGPFLDTGNYLAGLLQESGMPGWMLPTAVFVTSGFVAMSTGTSWGTMAILTPLAVELAILAGVGDAANSTGATLSELGGPLLLPVVGAVLAGSIFGDHCSPISDTTVLSSRASGCDHILHVRTQLPYAFSVGLITIFLGTIPSGFGFSAWLSLLIASVAIVAMVYAIGRRTGSKSLNASN